MQTDRDPYEPDREMQRRGGIRYATREEARAARLASYRRYDAKRKPRVQREDVQATRGADGF